MKFSPLKTAVAVCALLSVSAAYAQTQPKTDSAPAATQSEPPKSQGQSETKGKAQAASKTETSAPQQKGKSKSAQAHGKGGQGETQNGAEPTGTKAKSKASARKETTTKNKGTAESQQQQNKSGSSAEGKTAQGQAPVDQKTTVPTTAASTTAPKRGERVQVSEQQRTNISQAIVKDSHVNRATKVSFTVNVGTRIPRSVRLAVLPAAVITIVPQYRDYRYVVVDDRVCIVEPATYEIVEVISAGSGGGIGSTGVSASLSLTPDEELIVLNAVENRGGPTLGLGVLVEGNALPASADLRVLPDAVVIKVPKLANYKYFAAENRVALVGPDKNVVAHVIERRR